MTMKEFYLRMLDDEAVITRKILERVPAGKFDWKPHPKSMSLKRLAVHVAELPGWLDSTLNSDHWDFAENPYNPYDTKHTTDLLEYFENTLREGRKVLVASDEGNWDEDWTLSQGDVILHVSPRVDFLRMIFSQVIHHRAQLGVYLRLLNIPIPGSYGPSADEIE